MFRYIRYFIYLATNWNLRIAIHIIKNELRGEKKYGLDTTGADELEHLEKAGIDISHATIYMPASYDVLEKVFSREEVTRCRSLLDIGCGKGRVMAVAAHHGFRKIRGIEISPKLSEEARENMDIAEKKFPGLSWEIFNNDAFYFNIPPDVDCIFLFNPFDEVIMSGVAENIAISFEEHPRNLTIIYLNPLHQEIFKAYGFREKYHTIYRKYLEASVMTLEI